MRVGFQIVDGETVKICYVKSAELKLTAPAAESRKRITIWLGKKRYAVDLTMKAAACSFWLPRPPDFYGLAGAARSGRGPRTSVVH